MVPVYVNQFSEDTGPAIDSFRDVFQLFFTDTIVIVGVMTWYACLVMGEAKFDKLEKIGRTDVIAYFGIMMGLSNCYN